MELHHVGVATPDATGFADLAETLFDVPVVHEERVDGLDVVFLDAGGVHLELLEPVTGDGAVADYLDREGAGLHHVALATADLEAALATAREHGVTLVDETPRPGAWGHQVAFLHPRDTGGVLVELVGD